MRIFFAEFQQESNTGNPNKSEKSIFEHGYLLDAQNVIQALGNTNSVPGGFLEAAQRQPSVEMVPGFCAYAVASGEVTDETFNYICDRILDDLRRAMPVDGIVICLHGAMSTESFEDAESEILRRICRITEHKVPIAVALDYHANITEEMLRYSDILVGYRTYPHVDMARTGKRACEALIDIIRTGRRPVPVFCKLPLIVPVESSETGKGISFEALKQLDVLEENQNVVSTSLFCNQPWLDVRNAGVSVLLYAKEEQAISGLQREVERVADYIWTNREEFFQSFPKIEDVLRTPDQFRTPLILVDSGDVTTGGSTGESTHILRALLEHGTDKKAVLSIVSSGAVADAFALGVGNRGKIRIGNAETGYNSRVTVDAEVVYLNEAPSKITGASFQGLVIETGRRAHLCIRRTIHVIVMEHASLVFDTQFLREMKIQPEEMDWIVQKSHKLFRSAYEDIAKEIVLLDTPGCTDMNISRLDYRRVQRPIYPLDQIKDWRRKA